jgi:hypothetical protein
MRYFETLKETLKVYISYKDLDQPTLSLLDTSYFRELYIVQFRFIQDSFRAFVKTLKEATNGDFQSIIDTRMAAFIIFIIAIAIAYLILWTPFVNKLNREVRTSFAVMFLFVDMADEVDADDNTHRGDTEDPPDPGVPPQSDVLPGRRQGRCQRGQRAEAGRRKL